MNTVFIKEYLHYTIMVSFHSSHSFIFFITHLFASNINAALAHYDHSITSAPSFNASLKSLSIFFLLFLVEDS